MKTPRGPRETAKPERQKLAGVRYRKTASGWLEPMVQAPGWRTPNKVGSQLDLLVRLAKLGAKLSDPGPDGWAHYTTPQGTTGKLRLAPGADDGK